MDPKLKAYAYQDPVESATLTEYGCSAVDEVPSEIFASDDDDDEDPEAEADEDDADFEDEENDDAETEDNDDAEDRDARANGEHRSLADERREDQYDTYEDPVI